MKTTIDTIENTVTLTIGRQGHVFKREQLTDIIEQLNKVKGATTHDQVLKFLSTAYDYLLHKGNHNKGGQRTDNRVIKIMSDERLFFDTYDVMVDELNYYDIQYSDVIPYLKNIKQTLKEQTYENTIKTTARK